MLHKLTKNYARLILLLNVFSFCMTDEHNTAEYEKVNPFRLVPAIDDNGFKLTERLKFFCIFHDYFLCSRILLLLNIIDKK